MKDLRLPVCIIGAGGHAKVLIDALLCLGERPMGITDSASESKPANILGIPVLGDDEVVFKYSPEDILLVNGLGSTGLPILRQEIYARFKKKGYRFINVIHPAALIGRDVEIGEGVQIMAGAVLQTGIRIGNNTIVNTRASVDHDCVIGESVHIAPGVTLSGAVHVGDGVHIGTGAVVIQGVRIGPSSIVAAGAVVVDDIPERATASGVPAKVVK